MRGELFEMKLYNLNELITVHNYVLHEWFQKYIPKTKKNSL